MLDWLKGRAHLKRSGHQLYERIVAQARQPALYESCGVPDTMDGRLELILLHVVLVLDRLKREGNAGQRLGQRLLESLVADLDDALRQLGLGDDSVAGRVPRLAGALRERAQDYGLALDAAPAPTKSGKADVATLPDALETALLEHVYRPADAVASAIAIPHAMSLAAYVRRCRTTLAATEREALLAGEARFPAVA
jgi:cytochrome b pre-mRNA-processing protein 3